MIFNKKGSFLEIFIILIIIVLVSGTTLALVSAGILKPKSNIEQVNLLNTEFLPMGKEGYLSFKDFKFCGYVDEKYVCLDEKNEFYPDSNIYFLFIVESSVDQGTIKLVENYRLKGPDNQILLEVDGKNNYYFDAKSPKKQEPVYFKDYFTLGKDAPLGEYTLELLVEAPLFNKKATLTKKFNLVVPTTSGIWD